MASLDTNVLVRLLVRDDAAQWAIARQLMVDCLDSGETLHVPITVMIELEWVLRSAYRLDKSNVIDLLSELMSARELDFAFEHALEIALALYRDGSADYADCLHAALAFESGQAPLWTFDRHAARVPGAQLLKASAR